MAPKRRALYDSPSLELNQFAYNPRLVQQTGCSVVRPLSCMGQALAAKVNSTQNKQDALINREMSDNHPFVAAQKVRYTVPHPTQARMTNMAIVLAAERCGVWISVLSISISKFDIVLTSDHCIC